MLKKILILSLIFLVLNLSLSSVVFAETKTEKEAKFAIKVKANIEKLGVGTESRVQVKLKDGTKVKGYVSQINESSFVVIEDKTGDSVEIPYPNAKQVKGNNLNTGIKIAIAAGIIIALLLWLNHELGKS